MNTLTKIKRLALALCLATPFVSRAAIEFTDSTYQPWNGVSGAAAWRGDGGNFEVSKVADISADGTIGEAYAMAWNNVAATTSHRFCSGQNEYQSPGMLLVYDASGYEATANGTFGPLSFAGLKVDALADVSAGTPYELNSPNAGGARYTDFGVNGFSSYFEFNKSFIISRVNDLRCYGNVTIKAAEDATFKCTKALWIENNSTVALQGAGTVDLTDGLRMNTSSTLDLSATVRPTIVGAVTIPAGATLVLPEGTELDADVEVDICTGTLTVSGLIYVKVGDADAVETIVTTSEGKITKIDTGITYTEGFPTTVPAGSIYTYVGGATAEDTVEIAGVTVNGKLKTVGYVKLTNFTLNHGACLEIVDGNTTAVAYNDGYDNIIRGNIIVRADATLTTTQSDFLDWYGATSQTLDVYGTLVLGNTRWSIKTAANCTINFYPGARVTGTGDGNGVLDLIAADSKLNVYPGVNGGEVVIEGVVKTRNANTPIWVAANTTLKIGGLRAGGVNKSGNGTLEISGTIANPLATTVSEGTISFINTTTAVPLTVNAGKTVTASASENVTVPLNATLAADANITVSGAGTVNGAVTFSGFPSGTLTGLTTSTWQGTVTVPAGSGNMSKILNCGNANSVIEFAGTSGNNNYVIAAANTTYNMGAININGDTLLNNGFSGSIVNFAKISGTGALTLSSWSGCSSVRYNINKVEGYTGTLTVNNGITRDQGGTFTIGIGDIVTENTTPGVCVLPIVNSAVDNPTGTVVYNFDNAKLNGVAADLEVKDDGIYVKAPVANVTSADGQTVTPYYTVAEAFEAVDDGETLTLVGTAVTLDSDVTVEKSYTLAGDAQGTTVTGSGKIYLTGSTELTLDATLTSVGNQFWFSSKDAKLTFPTAGLTPVVRPYTAGGCQTGTTVNGDGTTTYYQYLFLQLQVGASNVTLAYYDSGDPLVSKQVFEGDEIVFTATPAEGYENPVVTANGNTLTPVDGKYTVVVGTVSVAIQATASQISDTYDITGSETLDSTGSFTVPAGTTKIKIGAYDVTAGFSIDGTTATLLAPEIVEETNKKAIDVGAITVTLNVELVPGLYYGVASGTGLTLTRPETLTQCTGSNDAAILTVTKPSTEKGFFKVFVDIKE